MQEYEKILNQKYNEVYNELSNEVFSNLPSRIYHYTSASSLQSIISNPDGKTKLRFTKWNFLNDFSELRYIHEVVEDNLHLLKADTPELYKYLKDINRIDNALKNDMTYPKIAKKHYILSFSLEPDLLNMWTYYTKSTQNDGYSIGFNTNELIQSIENANMTIIDCGNVIYNEMEQERIIKKVLFKIQEMYNILVDNEKKYDMDYVNWQIVNAFESYLNLLACYFKHPAFKEEKEVRLVFTNDADEPLEKVREKNGLYIPYVELTYNVETIEEVWISPTLQGKNAAYGLSILGEQHGVNWRIHQSKIPFRNI